MVRDAYANEFHTTPEVLVKTLLDAAGSTEDMDRRYIILREAQEAAAKAGLVDPTLEAVARVCESFIVNPEGERLAALQELAKQADRQPQKLYDVAIDAVAGFLDDDRLEDVETVLTIAEETAKTLDRMEKAKAAEIKRASQGRANPPAAKAPELMALARDYRTLLRTRLGAQAACQDAEPRLKTTPEDSAANAAVGFYLCLYRDRWEEGVPLLAKGDREPFKQAAVLEFSLGRSPAATEVLKVAEAWWKLAVSGDQPACEAAAIARYAFALYEQALPDLQDPLDQKLVQTRMSEAESRQMQLFGKGNVQKVGIKLAEGNYTLTAWCDDRAEVFVNEQPVLKCGMKAVKKPIVVPANNSLRIAAKCQNTGGPAMFILVVQDAAGQVVVSTAVGQGQWKSYLPPDPAEWWKADELRKLDSVPRFKGGIWAKGAVRECFLLLKGR
jgi:hypothetical protein